MSICFICYYLYYLFCHLFINDVILTIITCNISDSCQVAHKAPTLCLDMSFLFAAVLTSLHVLLFSLSQLCAAIMSKVDHISFCPLGTMSMGTLSFLRICLMYRHLLRFLSHRSLCPTLLSPNFLAADMVLQLNL